MLKVMAIWGSSLHRQHLNRWLAFLLFDSRERKERKNSITHVCRRLRCVYVYWSQLFSSPWRWQVSGAGGAHSTPKRQPLRRLVNRFSENVACCVYLVVVLSTPPPCVNTPRSDPAKQTKYAIDGWMEVGWGEVDGEDTGTGWRAWQAVRECEEFDDVKQTTTISRCVYNNFDGMLMPFCFFSFSFFFFSSPLCLVFGFGFGTLVTHSTARVVAVLAFVHLFILVD